MVAHREHFLSGGDWAERELRTVAASLPRGGGGRLDTGSVAVELRELLEDADLDVETLSGCRLGVPDALLGLDSSPEGGAASLLVQRIGDPDRSTAAASILVAARRRGEVFGKASEAFASSMIDSRLKELEPRAGFLLAAVNGVDLSVWRAGAKNSLIHIAPAAEGEDGTSYCGKKLGFNFYPADRGELRLSLDGAHPEGTKTCGRCLRHARKDGHPSLEIEGSPTTPPADLRENVRERTLGPVVEAIAAATDPDDLLDVFDEDGIGDSLETQVQTGLRRPAVEALLELPEDQRWRRLLGALVHRDDEIAACEVWPSFPDHTADRVLEHMSHVSGNEHTKRSQARSKAADIFKVRAGIRDLEAEKREAEEKRRSWRRWDRGRNHTDFSLSKELHLYVDAGGEAVFQGAVVAVAACGSNATYDPTHRGNRYGSPKCAKCEQRERELDAAA